MTKLRCVPPSEKASPNEGEVNVLDCLVEAAAETKEHHADKAIVILGKGTQFLCCLQINYENTSQLLGHLELAKYKWAKEA